MNRWLCISFLFFLLGCGSVGAPLTHGVQQDEEFLIFRIPSQLTYRRNDDVQSMDDQKLLRALAIELERKDIADAKKDPYFEKLMNEIQKRNIIKPGEIDAVINAFRFMQPTMGLRAPVFLAGRGGIPERRRTKNREIVRFYNKEGYPYWRIEEDIYIKDGIIVGWRYLIKNTEYGNKETRNVGDTTE